MTKTDDKEKQTVLCTGDHPQLGSRPVKLQVLKGVSKNAKGEIVTEYELREIKGQIEKYCLGCGAVVYKGSQYLRKPIESIWMYKYDHWHPNDFNPIKFHWVEQRKKRLNK